MGSILLLVMMYLLNIIYKQADKQDKEKLEVVSIGNIILIALLGVYEIIRYVR